MHQQTLIDAPPSSLMDSTMSPKVKTLEGKWVRVHSLARSTFGVEGCGEALGWGLGRLISESITHIDLHKSNNKLVSAYLDTFGARTNHEQTWTHKTHNGLDLGQTITFLLIVLFVLGHGASTQMSFCPKTPKWESRNSQNWEFRHFGGQ
jgi:hypothetical protein